MEQRLHPDELPIDANLVRRLIDAPFPRYADLSVERLGAAGSSNVLFRLGDEHLVRLPRQPGGGRDILKEQRWLPVVAPNLPVAVPEMVALGRPAPGFSEHWSIVRWLPGDVPGAWTASEPATGGRSRLAVDLASVIDALRGVPLPHAAADDPALRWYRGRPLAEFDAATRRSLDRCRSIQSLDLDLDAADAVWSQALELPGARAGGADRWYHSDLVSENLLLNHDRLTGVLDFGGLAVGDPTVDLHGAWELLDPPARETFRRRLGADEAEWLRGRAWALGIALGALAYYWTSMPDRCRDRLAMARSVLADATR